MTKFNSSKDSTGSVANFQSEQVAAVTVGPSGIDRIVAGLTVEWLGSIAAVAFGLLFGLLVLIAVESAVLLVIDENRSNNLRHRFKVQQYQNTCLNHIKTASIDLSSESTHSFVPAAAPSSLKYVSGFQAHGCEAQHAWRHWDRLHTFFASVSLLKGGIKFV